MINLVYWSESNFGDALSPLLIEELSGEKTRLKAAYINKLRRFVKSILYFSPKEFDTILLPWQSNILGIGSVITCGNKQSKVWGSGFMSNFGSFNGGDIFAVRGPLTAHKLVQQGFKRCVTYGDPALLLPLWLAPSKSKTYKLGIVPHWKETDTFSRNYGDTYKVIDLRTRDVEKVVKEITSCEYILSTSLHGLIVAHAYNIPALWIKEGFIETDGFKFDDYFSSVGIPAYKGFDNLSELFLNENNWMALFAENRNKSLIDIPLEGIQKELLRTAPFPLQNKYKRFISSHEE